MVFYELFITYEHEAWNWIPSRRKKPCLQSSIITIISRETDNEGWGVGQSVWTKRKPQFSWSITSAFPSSSGNGKGISIRWQSWARLARAKELGGMGFCDLQVFNFALLGKQGWNFIHNPTLW